MSASAVTTCTGCGAEFEGMCERAAELRVEVHELKGECHD